MFDQYIVMRKNSLKKCSARFARLLVYTGNFNLGVEKKCLITKEKPITPPRIKWSAPKSLSVIAVKL